MNAQVAPEYGSPYRIRHGEYGDDAHTRAAAIHAWRGSLGDDDAVLGDRYDAVCVHAPGGQPVIRFVEHVDDGIVGFLGLAPRRMRAGGRELRAGVLSHLAIHPGHRSLGPALMLLESVLAAAEGRFDLVYGVPNANQGATAALRRAGMRPLASMERNVRIVRHGSYLARRLPAWVAGPAGMVLDAADGLRLGWDRFRVPRLRARWSDHFDPAMRDLPDGSSVHPALTAVRDETMLRWRFDAAVGIQMRYLMVEQAGGPLRAWFACCVDPQWPHILAIHDFWSRDALDGIDRRLLRVLLGEARRRGYSAVSVRAALEPGASAPWRANGFRTRDAQQVMVRWLDPALAAAPPPPHLTYIDQDG